MTRKNYELIAAAFRDEYATLKDCHEFEEMEPEAYKSTLFGFRRAVYAFCTVAKADNARFDGNRFYQAVGIK